MKRRTAPAPTRAQLARSIYDALGAADRSSFLGTYRPGKVTIDGHFNLAIAALELLNRFWPLAAAEEPTPEAAAEFRREQEQP